MKQVIKNKSQLFRFGVVGVINTAIDFGVLFALSSIGIPKIAANTCSTGIAFVFSFFANKKYTFKSSSKTFVREILLFVVVTLFGLWVLQNGVIWLISPLISNFISSQEIVLLIAKLVGTIISLTWNYLMYDRVVFFEGKK